MPKIVVRHWHVCMGRHRLTNTPQPQKDMDALSVLGIAMLVIVVCTTVFGFVALYGRRVSGALNPEKDALGQYHAEVGRIRIKTTAPGSSDAGDEGDLWVDTQHDVTYLRKGNQWVKFSTFTGDSGTQWLTGRGAPQDGRPSTLQPGDHYLDELTGSVYVSGAGGKWALSGTVQGDTAANIVYNGHTWRRDLNTPTAPPTPSVGDMWLQPNTGVLSVWTALGWQPVASHAGDDGVQGEGSPTWLFSTTSPPTVAADPGTFHVNTATMDLHRYQDGGWVLLDEGQLPSYWTVAATDVTGTPARAGLFYHNSDNGKFWVSTATEWQLLTQVEDVAGAVGEQRFLSAQWDGTAYTVAPSSGALVNYLSTDTTPTTPAGVDNLILHATDSGTYTGAAGSFVARKSVRDTTFIAGAREITAWNGSPTGYPIPLIRMYDETGARLWLDQITDAYSSAWSDTPAAGSTYLQLLYPTEGADGSGAEIELDPWEANKSTFLRSINGMDGNRNLTPGAVVDPWLSTSAQDYFFVARLDATDPATSRLWGTQVAARLEGQLDQDRHSRVLDVTFDPPLVDGTTYDVCGVGINIEARYGVGTHNTNRLQEMLNPARWSYTETSPGSGAYISRRLTFTPVTTASQSLSGFSDNIGIAMRINTTPGGAPTWEWHVAVVSGITTGASSFLDMITHSTTPYNSFNGFNPYWPMFTAAVDQNLPTHTISNLVTDTFWVDLASFAHPTGRVYTSGSTNGIIIPAPATITVHHKSGGLVVVDSAADTVTVRPSTEVQTCSAIACAAPYTDDVGTASAWTFALELDPFQYTATQQAIRPDWFFHGLDLWVGAARQYGYNSGSCWTLRVRCPVKYVLQGGVLPIAIVEDMSQAPVGGTRPALEWDQVANGLPDRREDVGYEDHMIGHGGYNLLHTHGRSTGAGWSEDGGAPGNTVHVRAIPSSALGELPPWGTLARVQLAATPTYSSTFLANKGVENGGPYPSLGGELGVPADTTDYSTADYPI